jgi:hypothetical protein
MRPIQTMRAIAAALALAALAACDRAGSEEPAASMGEAGAARPGGGSTASAGAAASVRTADRPADACGWIPAEEVEAIIGSLAGPPRPHQGDCLYPVPLDSESVRRRELAAKLGELAKQMAERAGEKYEPIEDRLPTEPAVIVGVRLEGSGPEQAVFAASGAVMAKALGEGSGQPAPEPKAPPPPEGWDEARSSLMIGVPGFWGRLGHVNVLVQRQAVIIPHEKLAALAARVRDRIPDLPFAYPGPGSAPAGGREPCSLVTAHEAEAVLGTLVAPPYRSHESTPLAESDGKSCTYLTAGHRALVLTPTWEYGGMAVEAIRSVGGFVGIVAPDLHEIGADTLDGDWEEAGSDRTTGQLYFLKGERLLEIGYLLSSTDADGAVRLARIAMGRL